MRRNEWIGLRVPRGASAAPWVFAFGGLEPGALACGRVAGLCRPAGPVAAGAGLVADRGNATDPSSSATASPSPKREVTATPSPSGTAVPKSTAAPSQGADTANGDDVRHREYWLNEYGITSLWSQATG